MEAVMTPLGAAMGKALRRFRRDRRGVSAVEFGFLAVPFLGLIGAIFETGFVFFSSTGLQSAVQLGARNMLTGIAQANGANVNTAAQFNQTYVCPNLPSFVSCSSLITDVRTATSFSGADTSKSFYNNPSSMQFCPGAPGQIMIVRVIYPMPDFFPILSSSGGTITTGLVSDVPNNPGLKHLLMATVVFQTEPFNSQNYNKANYSTCP